MGLSRVCNDGSVRQALLADGFSAFINTKITFSLEDGSEEEEFIRTMMSIAEGEKANIGPESDDTEFERKSKEVVKLYK